MNSLARERSPSVGSAVVQKHREPAFPTCKTFRQSVYSGRALSAPEFSPT